MAKKITIALKRGASCVGCDIAVLNFNEDLLTLLSVADIVFAPTILDVKYDDLRKMPDKSITIGLYHGAVRNSDNAELAKIMRAKCQILIAYGACAHLGGIPGLANCTTKQKILEQVYCRSVSTTNPQRVFPKEKSRDSHGHELTLPELYEEVKTLDEVVDVDYFVPACPPPPAINMKILKIVKDFVEKGTPLPPKGTVIASERTLCDECLRKKSPKLKIGSFTRLHQVELDPEKCFLEQGILCLGPATRGGCDAICTKVNMPCRGCMGPTAAVCEQGASMLSAIASLYGLTDKETELTEEQIIKLMSEIIDPLGYFYRYSLPKSELRRVVEDKEK
jgi:F420-non-reducing hydrogenase small subunit